MLLFNEVRIAICQWPAVVCPQSPNELEQAFAELEAYLCENARREVRCIRQKPDSNTVRPRIRPGGGCLKDDVYATLNR